MLHHVRLFATALALVGLLLAPAPSALASSGHSFGTIENETAPPMFDAIVLRPLGLLGLGVSAALWIPAQAFTMAFRPDEWRTPIDRMLVAPYEFVFVDPLGSH